MGQIGEEDSMTFRKGDRVRLACTDCPPITMLVADVSDRGVSCIWFDRDYRVQGYMFPAFLLEETEHEV